MDPLRALTVVGSLEDPVPTTHAEQKVVTSEPARPGSSVQSAHVTATQVIESPKLQPTLIFPDSPGSSLAAKPSLVNFVTPRPFAPPPALDAILVPEIAQPSTT